MPETVLDVRNLRVEFATDQKPIQAVNGIDFQLQAGQVLGLVGESGSGKSVTALALIGLLPAPGRVTSGEVCFYRATSAEPLRVDLLRLPPKERCDYRGSQIAMIFQEPMSSLNPVYTCGFQLIEALRQHQQIAKPEARRQAIALLQEVKLIPSDSELRQQIVEEHFHPLAPDQLQTQINQRKLAFLDRFPHQLSGGQIQRVMIAIAISCNPAVLIADEPTTALDVTVQATILDLLRELRDRRGMSIIFVTHDLGIIAEIADTVAVMYQGKIVETGSVQQIYQQPRHPYTKGLLACRPQPDRSLQYLPTISDFMAVEPGSNGEPILKAKTTDRLPLEISPQQRAERQQALEQQPALLRVDRLKVFFPVRGMFGQTTRYLPAVNDVSFQVYPGETLGLVGESGCGKTTLGRSLLRLVEPTDGQIIFDGQDLTSLGRTRMRQARRNLQIIFQDPYSSLDPRLSIGAAVMEPLRIHQPKTPTKQLRDRVADLLERVGLQAEMMHRYPHEFSGGQRQRVCIARALALSPRFIICDESVSALDVSVQAQVLNLLKALQTEFNLTYIFISHDLSVVKFISDRIMVMNRGKIEEINSAEAVYRHPQQPYTRQLIASIPKGRPPALPST
ncbi:MAG: ABC transporter ATP-binding protein [Aphanocapsa sp. GSE-SYN-MK-11-07L]|jgi:peptide/nickel transport system ATP-binding protein|nr:ABC transporter ATP-binding protein [Aphanocapsa sp. GSE-SYN-MK-11-07L]